MITFLLLVGSFSHLCSLALQARWDIILLVSEGLALGAGLRETGAIAVFYSGASYGNLYSLFLVFCHSYHFCFSGYWSCRSGISHSTPYCYRYKPLFLP